MLLYNSPVSGNCYKVRLLLAQLGLPYETTDVSVVDRSNREELLGDLNPGLRVPTLVLDGGPAARGVERDPLVLRRRHRVRPRRPVRTRPGAAVALLRGVVTIRNTAHDEASGRFSLSASSGQTLPECSGMTPEPTVQDETANNSDDSPADGIQGDHAGQQECEHHEGAPPSRSP